MTEFVGNMGVNEHAVKRLRQLIENVVHRRRLVRSDQEPAITALLDGCVKSFHASIVKEQSRAYASRSNGFIEASLQSLEK